MSSEDRAVLVALFRSTGGTRWLQNSKWDKDADLSRWYGVYVNDDGRVVKLNLNSNNLEGILSLLRRFRKHHMSAFTLMCGGVKPDAVLDRILSRMHLVFSFVVYVFVSSVLGASLQRDSKRIFDLRCFWTSHRRQGCLRNTNILRLRYSSTLSRTTPEALGSLTELQVLRLGSNKLTGSIPEALGALKKLTCTDLGWNELTGSIPARLGSLKKLRQLVLSSNQLAGPIPEALGALKDLTDLWLNDNKITGHIPKELGNLEKLQALNVENNQLTGAIPTELGNLRALSTFKFGNNNAPKSIWRRRKKLSGGPAKGEELDSWRERIRSKRETKPQTLKGDIKEEDAPVPPTSPPQVLLPQHQQAGEGDEKEEDGPAPLDSPNQRQEVVGERVRSPERASLSPGMAEKVDRLFQAQLSSSAGLDSLIKENPAALEDIQRVLEVPAAGSLYPDDELREIDGRRKLGTLVTMSTALGEIVLRHTEDVDIQRKEMALPAFSKEYYSAIRRGLCQAYLAASVIESERVSTSKTGGMGKAGAALNLISSAIPVVGGLAGLAGKAFETCDHYLQTRRLVKITAMAPDAVECCSLARRLALQLTDRLRHDASTRADHADDARTSTTAGMNGSSGFGRGADMMPGDMSEEDVFEYLLEEVASYERNDHGGKRLGNKHVCKLLKAIQRGCLDGLSCTEHKIKVLLLEVLPEADDRPAATSSTPKEVIVRSPPVGAATQDRELPSMADFAAMQLELAALKSAKDKQQAELEEQQAKIEAVESRNKQLRDKMSAMEKRVPDRDSEPCDRVNAGGGHVLQKKLEMKEDLDTFWQRKKNAAGAGDQGILTPAEHQAETRDTRARVDDVDDRVDSVEAQLAALKKQQAGKKKGF
ncbi:unnamed protein product [Ectocarpus sp. 12 AP-2014]